MSKLFNLAIISLLMSIPTKALVPFTRPPFWDIEDPFRILEQTTLPIPKPSIDLATMAIAKADWKETESKHIITLDIPGMKRDDLKIEVEENRVLRISGERKVEDGEDKEGDKWHRVERTVGKFWRQFRMPINTDLDNVKAELVDGVLKITVPKIGEDRRKKSKVVEILNRNPAAAVGHDDHVKASKTDL